MSSDIVEIIRKSKFYRNSLIFYSDQTGIGRSAVKKDFIITSRATKLRFQFTKNFNLLQNWRGTQRCRTLGLSDSKLTVFQASQLGLPFIQQCAQPDNKSYHFRNETKDLISELVLKTIIQNKLLLGIFLK